jgi:energy-coupling factor transporter ATP-binding protein EcfA2
VETVKRETVYSLEGVTFSYPGGLCGVREVDLEICLGEEVVLLGANGTGKSTLLRILGGLIFPDEGRVTFRGISLDPETVRDSVFRSSFRQQVCILFQDPEVQLFCSSVREEVLFGPTQLGLPFEQSDMRVRELISLFGLEQVAERQPFRMSHGEKKKVAIAALLAVNPSVLLLDEPTAGLDPASGSRSGPWPTESHGSCSPMRGCSRRTESFIATCTGTGRHGTVTVTTTVRTKDHEEESCAFSNLISPTLLTTSPA